MPFAELQSQGIKLNLIGRSDLAVPFIGGENDHSMRN